MIKMDCVLSSLCCDWNRTLAGGEFEEFRNSCGEYLVLLWYCTDFNDKFLLSQLFGEQQYLAIWVSCFKQVWFYPKGVSSGVVLHENIVYH